jgi:hypothetical protein
VTKQVRDLEHHFNIGGRVHVAQVCSPSPHSPAPVSDSRGEWETAIFTCAADDLHDFEDDDPHFLAQRVVVDISTRLPNVPEAELASFYAEVVAWIGEHRRVAANAAQKNG